MKPNHKKNRPLCLPQMLLVLISVVSNCDAATIISHWRLDETSAPFKDSGLTGINLNRDTNTTVSPTGQGMAGAGVLLNWQSVPGISTRLYATNSALQTDSFGFSFWVNPVAMNAWDNLLAKEMSYNSGLPGYSRIAWQVHLVGDVGNGYAPLEFIVRGDNRAAGDFYGNVLSAINLPLSTNNAGGAWYHIAGGYDAGTGALNLFVNGVETDSANSSPGAHNSDGSPVDIGTAKNGPDYVFFAANALMDDVQIYNGPLLSGDVDYLMSNPGFTLGIPVVSQYVASNPNTNVTITFNSYYGQDYAADVSTNSFNYFPVTNLTASAISDYTTVTIPKSLVDGVFGPASRQQLYVRMRILDTTPDCN